MANSASTNKEKEGGLVSAQEKARVGSEQSREVLEASKSFIEGLSSIVEAGENSEISEFNEGNVGEVSGEGKNRAAGGAAKGGAAKARKKEVPEPSIEIMQIQVSTKIEKEIRILEKEAAKLMSAGKSNFSPHKLNAVIGRIRSLREILANLVFSTADSIKTLWIKYVKGNVS